MLYVGNGVHTDAATQRVFVTIRYFTFQCNVCLFNKVPIIVVYLTP